MSRSARAYSALWCWIALLTWLPSTAVVAMPPQVVIRAIGAAEDNPTLSGMAPLVVNVDGLDSQLFAGEALTARYQWDFGDPAGAHNQLVGWSAAHVYDQPGLYTLRLWVRDELGRLAQGAIVVNVLADGHTPIHVDALGDDDQDGRTPQTAIRSVARAQQLLGSRHAVWLRRGQVHDFSAQQLEISGLSEVLIGAYGDGMAPMVLGPPFTPNPGNPNLGLERTLIAVENRPGETPIDQVLVQDLHFTTPNPAGPATEDNHVALQVNGAQVRNVVFRRNHCNDIGSCFKLSKGSWPEADGYVYPHGFAAIDNSAGELSSYFTFMAGYHLSLIGNTVTGGSHTQWIFRYYADRVLVTRNHFQQPVSTYEEYAVAGGQHCIPALGQLVEDCDGDAGNVEWGQYSYIVDNHFDGTLRLGYEGFRNGKTVYQSQRQVVVEGNVFRRAAPNQAPTPTLRHFPYTRQLRIRNNLFLGPVGVSSFSAEQVSDIEFAHNTGLSAENSNMLSGFYGPLAAPGSFRFLNNLWVLPNYHPDQFGGFPFVLASPHAGLEGYRFAGNVWPQRAFGSSGEMLFGGQITASQWLNLPQVSGDRFALLPLNHLDASYLPPAASPARGQGGAVAGVQVDFYGRPRPLSGPQIAGAVIDPVANLFDDGFE